MPDSIKDEKDFNQRLAVVEENCRRLKNIEDLAGENKNSILQILRILQGKWINGDREPGLVDRIEHLEHFREKYEKSRARLYKVLTWVIGLIVAPLLGLIGLLTVKILAHIDEIIKLINNIEKVTPK